MKIILCNRTLFALLLKIVIYYVTLFEAKTTQKQISISTLSANSDLKKITRSKKSSIVVFIILASEILKSVILRILNPKHREDANVTEGKPDVPKRNVLICGHDLCDNCEELIADPDFENYVVVAFNDSIIYLVVHSFLNDRPFVMFSLRKTIRTVNGLLESSTIIRKVGHRKRLIETFSKMLEIVKLEVNKEIPCSVQIRIAPSYPFHQHPRFVHAIFLYSKKLIKDVAQSSRQDWNVGYINLTQIQHDQDDCRSCNEIIFPKKSGNFLADPFIWRENSETFVFCEEFSKELNRGVISCFKKVDGFFEKFGTAIDMGIHTSFPFLFTYQGVTYMTLESATTNGIKVFKSIDFPLQWKLHSTTLSEDQWVDPIIINHKKRWFLLAHSRLGLFDEFDWRLRVFHSDNPTDGSWLEIPESALKYEFGRNGGFIKTSDALIRVSQIRDPRTYGKSFQLNKIIVLSEDKYEEIYLPELVQLENVSNYSQVHHINLNHGEIVWDYC
jgi:hypothetical protein